MSALEVVMEVAGYLAMNLVFLAGWLAVGLALAVFGWRACAHVAAGVCPGRPRALACYALGLVLALGGGVLGRTALLGQRVGLGPVLLLVLLAATLAVGLVRYNPKISRLVFVLLCALAVFQVATLPPNFFDGYGHAMERQRRERMMNLHELGMALAYFSDARGEYPRSLSVLVAEGRIEQSLLAGTPDGRWICYWPPREDSRAAEIVAYYWPPHDGRTEVLCVDQAVNSAEVQPGKGLVNPRTGEVTWGPRR